MNFHYSTAGDTRTACGLTIAPYPQAPGLALSRVYTTWENVTCQKCLLEHPPVLFDMPGIDPRYKVLRVFGVQGTAFPFFVIDTAAESYDPAFPWFGSISGSFSSRGGAERWAAANCGPAAAGSAS